MIAGETINRGNIMSVYVIVADSARARILSGDAGSGPLLEKQDLVHPESRQRQQDLVSDADDFARELVAEIEKIHRSGDLGRLYLVAAPRFLGLLRGHLSKPCRELVAGEIDKDLVRHGIDDIRAQLPRHL